jgi:hypothetical protein
MGLDRPHGLSERILRRLVVLGLEATGQSAGEQQR